MYICYLLLKYFCGKEVLAQMPKLVKWVSWKWQLEAMSMTSALCGLFGGSPFQSSLGDPTSPPQLRLAFPQGHHYPCPFWRFFHCLIEFFVQLQALSAVRRVRIFLKWNEYNTAHVSAERHNGTCNWYSVWIFHCQTVHKALDSLCVSYTVCTVCTIMCVQ